MITTVAAPLLAVEVELLVPDAQSDDLTPRRASDLCVTGNVPAATLLLPYFEVDVGSGCNDATSMTTYFAVNNAAASPIVAHVTVWTDRSVPALNFDVFLTGYDVQTFNVKNFFCSGNLSQTANNGSHPNSPLGAFSNPTNPDAFLACDASATVGTGPPPNYAKPAISRNFRNHLKAWFTGLASPIISGSVCAGTDRGNDIAVGYITVDAAVQCSAQFSSDADYFDTATGIISNENVLWGDYQYADRNEGRFEMFTMVHIEADPQFADNGPTFYGRYTFDELPTPFNDQREPLPTTWAARYNTNETVNLFTHFQIWREGPDQNSWSCDSPPPGIGLSGGANSLIGFNEREDPSVVPPLVGLPYAASRFRVGDVDHLPTMFDNGWYYLNLQNDANSVTAGQAYLTVTQQLPNVAGGVFSGGMDGIAFDGQCAPDIMQVPGSVTTENPAPP